MAELKNEFSWSFSASRGLQECPRKHYLSKYKHWKGWLPKSAKDKRLAYRLKKMTSMPAWKGDVVHRCAKHVLLNAKRGIEMPFGDVCEWITQTAKREYNISLQNCKAEMTNPKSLALAEHYYPRLGKKWINESSLPNATEDMLTWIDNFYHGEIFAMVKALDTHNWLALEDLDKFQVAGANVWVVMDLCYRTEEDHCVIVDWKTGKRKQLDNKQLHVYAMYAAQHWGFDPESIHLQVVYLKEGLNVIDTYEDVTPQDLADTEEFIVNDIKKMREQLECPELNVPYPENHYKKNAAGQDSWLCQNCSFYKMCWDN